MSHEPVLEVYESPVVPPPPVLSAGEQPEEEREGDSAGLARATTILAVGNIASRLLGFVKEILLANYFGAGRLVDAFQIAITIPQDLYDLTISGYVNSALVPVLSEYAVRDRAELWRLTSILLGLVTVVTSAIVLLLEIFTPQVVILYRGNINPAALSLTAQLLQLTAPALIFQSLFAVASGLLYALRRFTWPAFAAALFNGTIVVTMVVLAPVIGIERAAIGFLLGAILQFALQFGGLRGTKVSLQLRGALSHPGVRRIGLLYIPVLASLIMDIIIRLFSYNLASQGPNADGNIAYMNWGTSLREFPLGLVGTAISIAILPTLARQALKPETRQQFKNTLGQGIRLALTLIVPATVGMLVLAGPLVGLVFERGAFTASNTYETSIVLRLYLLGIPFAAVDLLLVYAFYAVKDTLTPALVGIFSLACYIVIALALQHKSGFLSLMIADSGKHIIHMTLCIFLLRRKLKGLGSQRIPKTLLKVILATLVMALVTYMLELSAERLWPVQGLAQRAILVMLPATFGIITYFILASLLKLNDFTVFIQDMRRKIRK
ncbi:MAG TPA: murein biosynthesis integral membrane protein MurJ [Aggregatilineales bacterium]|nr:murein biosynthesis integral membrane protein MurJ [Aggregatilineales bacterium]